MIVFRNDDIFLTKSVRSGQIYNFKKFKESHELLKGRIHILSIIASEIDNYPEMKDYILANKKDFRFGIHGNRHENYSTWNEIDIYNDLKLAKNIIDKTFETNTKWFFPPWNRISNNMINACNKLQLKINKNYIIPTQFLLGVRGDVLNFHYWNNDEMKKLIKCLDIIKNNNL